jgi:putative oxidoreductase
MNTTFGADSAKASLLLVARILMMLLFVIFGWEKLTEFQGTVGYFGKIGVPMPAFATLIAVVMEFFVGLALILGVLTRPLAIVLAVYTLGTALLGHHFWTMSGMDRVGAEINFFKNISIIAGLLLLYLTGAGKYSVDAKIKLG